MSSKRMNSCTHTHKQAGHRYFLYCHKCILLQTNKSDRNVTMGPNPVFKVSRSNILWRCHRQLSCGLTNGSLTETLQRPKSPNTHSFTLEKINHGHTRKTHTSDDSLHSLSNKRFNAAHLPQVRRQEGKDFKTLAASHIPSGNSVKRGHIRGGGDNTPKLCCMHEH